ncbi:hypothetical protein AB5N19_14524 [Seiridium cardinale]|uniref:F-box domain-containing protein n=1 Tax=Seiridium cardinale TaxID=138064 RepID=A0ABR2XQV4_9PEZI
MPKILSLAPELLHMIAYLLSDPKDFWSWSITCKHLRYMFPLKTIAESDAEYHRRTVLPNIEIPFGLEEFPMISQAIRSKASHQVIKIIIDAYVKKFPAALNGEWGRLDFNLYPLHEACEDRRRNTVKYLLGKGCRVDLRDISFDRGECYRLPGRDDAISIVDALTLAIDQTTEGIVRLLLDHGHPVHNDHLDRAVLRKDTNVLFMLLEALKTNPAIDAGEPRWAIKNALDWTVQSREWDENEAVIDLLLSRMTFDVTGYLPTLVWHALQSDCPRNALHIFRHWAKTCPDLNGTSQLLVIFNTAMSANHMDLVREIHPAFTKSLTNPGCDPLLTHALRAATKHPDTVLNEVLPYLFETGCRPCVAHLQEAVLNPNPVPFIDAIVAGGVEMDGKLSMQAAEGHILEMDMLSLAIKQWRGPAVFRLFHHGARLTQLDDDIVQSLSAWYFQTFRNPNWAAAADAPRLIEAAKAGGMNNVSIFSSTDPTKHNEQLITLFHLAHLI